MPDFDLEAVRARLFLRCLLPLLKVVVEDRPPLAKRLAKISAALRFEVPGTEVGAQLVFDHGALRVEHGDFASPTVTIRFASAHRLSEFFAGKPSMPRIRGLFRHLPFTLRALGLVRALRIVAPNTKAKTDKDRALRVRLLLYMIAYGLSRLHAEGHPAMRSFVAKSPERVYQWSVADVGIGAYLRVHEGKAKAGRGMYAQRRPFVHFIFPTVGDALAVFDTKSSQMEAVEKGRVHIEGSPEYSRKISILAQKLDALLLEGEA
jgi:hypothetical protein